MNRAIETYEEAMLQIHVSTYKPVSGSTILQKWSITEDFYHIHKTHSFTHDDILQSNWLCKSYV
jgi:hypothetical protein